MKTVTKVICFWAIFFVVFFSSSVNAQTGVLDPDDPVITYNAASPPATPAYGTLAKWVRTRRVSFNTDSYKAYFYKGIAFRLKFPKSYKDSLSNPNKKYPIFVFFHGVGERGSVYDNEYQLYHGGQRFRDYVDNGTFDGFLLYIQSSSGSGGFNTTHYSIVNELINNYFIPQLKVDINRVIVDGLSGGGGATWQFLQNYPKLVAAAMPISAVAVADFDPSDISMNKFTPIWLFQGGLDTRPDPNTAHNCINAYKAAGANISYTEWPTLGHGCWNQSWALPDFPVFMNKAHKANPWPLFGRTEFCPGDPINQVLGVMAGFDGYEWRKNGTLIAGATSNTYTATTLGVYSCRIRRGTEWSPWSPEPVELKLKGATVSPDIQPNGFFSNVIPSPDGKTSIELMVPTGYTSYNWQREGSPTVLSTTNTLTVSTPGQYKVQVTEEFGCSSAFSNLYAVVGANGPNPPPAASGLIATSLSKTAIKLDWTQNNSPSYNETGFEIYSATAIAGPYKLVAVTAQDAITYTDNNLLPNTSYFYKIRAINNTAGSDVTGPATAQTQADSSPPTAPGNLRIASTSRNSIELIWDESTDDVGIYKYDIYVNGVKYYESDVAQATVYNLQHHSTYNIRVRARDFAGNISPYSNQVTGQPLSNGLNYKYYTFTGTWNQLPDFNLLDPVTTGVVPNVTISNRTQNDNFAYLWEGLINIPVSGNYRFRTNSDDGSRLWLGSLGSQVSPYSFSGTPLVNNDGLHGSQNVTSSTISLAAGTYPIAIAFYEQGGGEAMTVSWNTPQTGTSYQTIPNSAFADAPVINGLPPAAPSGLSAAAISYKQINLTWADNSNNETGFEIWRSTDPDNNFLVVGNVAANATSYQDSTLEASTTYYYKMRSIGQYGESGLVPLYDIQSTWRFNNNYTDESGSNHNISGSNGPTFSTDKQEGSHSINLDGSNDYINVTSSSGDYLRGGYSSKSIVFWMKADNPSSNDGIFDFGGSDDGLAMRVNSNQLYAGIASNNSRKSISSSYNSIGWNHIALIYDANTLRLYVNGTQVAANTDLGFTSIGTTSNGSRIGDDNSSNALNSSFGVFDGNLDDFWVIGNALTQTEIVSLMNGTFGTSASATTLALPSLPTAPSGLLALGTSSSKISVNWSDNSTDESNFELYRSSNDNSNYVLYKTLPANTSSYADTGLFSNSVFYYKVRAVNIGGNSAYSNESSASTQNNAPVLAVIADQYMRYGTVLQLNVTATDADPELLTIQVSNLPSFGSYTSNGNGTGTISFSPSLSDVGVYNNITVQVTDEHGGVSEASFKLTVNSNDNPELGAVSNISVDENQQGQLNLSASDANGDPLTWTFTNLPSFATPVINGNSVQINVGPGYANAGVYTVGVKVEDGHDGSDTASFVITVNDVNLNTTIYVNFTNGTYTAPAPWNNTGKAPAINDDFANLKDATGATTPVGVRLVTAWNGASNAGANTGNNSGVYPDAVLRSSYFTNTTRTVRIYGLGLNSTYTFTLLASRANPTVGVVTNYTIGGQTLSLNAANNSQNTVSFTNIVPDPDGSVTLNVSVAAGSAYGYLNSLVIESSYNDGTVPAAPLDLTVQANGSKVRLTWNDAAYNEEGYEVYRSTTLGGVYTLLNPGGNNAGLELYDDNAVQGHTTYYYYVRAVNSYGGTNSDTVSYTTPNAAPVLSPISDVNMATGQVVDVNVTATDEPGDAITLQVSGLPAFASLTDNGDGTGVIHIAPGTTTGQYTNITVTAIDNGNASSSVVFSITVADANLRKSYVNFNQTMAAASPWNNMNSSPSAGATISNLLDNSGAATGESITLLDSWTNQTTTGYSTGNNSGLYPDNVMVTSYYYASTTNSRRIRLGGLSTAKRYNLVFFASRNNYATPLTTRYTAGGQSVELNAQNNTSNTVRINDIEPNASGQIEFTAQAVVGPNAYIGALVIESYTPDLGNPQPPSTITAAGISTTQIRIDWEGVPNNGYEVWRSTTAEGTYIKVADVATNINTYTNSGLTAATVYYYKIRTKLSSNLSDYSEYAGASTVAYTLNLNLNDGTAGAPAQGGNWNNTNALIADGYTLSNMINDQGQSTGINFNVVTTFSGFNYYGASTGNNTGIYPDNTMKSFYYCNYADTARLRITGLTLAHKYNFVFFGSRVNPSPGVGVTTAYKIGNTVATLDAANNTQNVVKIAGVLPEPDGSVSITIYGTLQGGFGYLNVLSIEGAPVVGGGYMTRSAVPVSPVQTAVVVNPPGNAGTGLATNQLHQRGGINGATVEMIPKAEVYPNPFRDDVTLKFDLKENINKFTVLVSDLSGAIVHMQEVRNASKGIWLERLRMGGKMLPAGIYMVRVIGIPGYEQRSLRIIKQE